MPLAGTDTERTVGRIVVMLFAALVAIVVGWVLFVVVPGDLAGLLGVILVLATVAVALRLGGQIASSLFPPYNVGQVAVEGTITRNGGTPSVPPGPRQPGADDIIDLIEQADEDDNTRALVVKLNTPGGQVLPSDDIRLAAERFDGPTVAYATDICASGGYWIASGCDELWAREGSIVGSIGVRSPRMTATELLDRLGLEYEQFAAGRYKEAGSPFTEMDDDERQYLQGIVDAYYEEFVDRVVEGRDMDPQEVRETEARVYLGSDAREAGLVDELGTREDIEDHLTDELGEDVRIREFEPQRGLADRLRGTAHGVAYALGAGIASAFVPDSEFDLHP